MVNAPDTRPARAEVVALALALLALTFTAGCGGTGDPESAAAVAGQRTVPSDRLALRSGTRPVALEFLVAHENVRRAPYYPLEGLAAVAWGLDGTLILADDKRGRVFGFDPSQQIWYEFDSPGARPYQPADVKVDGFKVLVLDAGTQLLYRFELGGAFQDRLLNFRSADPAYDTRPAAFDIDLDGRLVVADNAEQQVVVFDAFMTPTQRVGEPGSHQEQFDQPVGVVFQPDGGFVVAERGNARLQRYNRLGFFEAVIGGEFDFENPFRAPSGLDADEYGNLFVADAPAAAIHVLDPDGELQFSAGHELPLVAVPQAPVDVAVGPEGLLAVADRGRSAVLVFRIIYE